MTRLDIRVEIEKLVLSEKDSIGILCTETLPTMLANVQDVLEGKAKPKELPCNLSLLHNCRTVKVMATRPYYIRAFSRH